MRRYYIDTSVFGGCFEGEWIEPSVRLLDHVRNGRVTVVTSAIVQGRLKELPTGSSASWRGSPGMRSR